MNTLLFFISITLFHAPQRQVAVYHPPEPKPVFAVKLVPVSTALYITKAEYLTTLKRKADNANLYAQLSGLTSGWGNPISERFYGKEEAYLDALDYASFLAN